MLNRLVSDAAGNLIDYAYSAGLSVESELHDGSYLLPRELFGSRSELFRLRNEKKSARPQIAFRRFKTVRAEIRQLIKKTEQIIKFLHAEKLEKKAAWWYTITIKPLLSGK